MYFSQFPATYSLTATTTCVFTLKDGVQCLTMSEAIIEHVALPTGAGNQGLARMDLCMLNTPDPGQTVSGSV